MYKLVLYSVQNFPPLSVTLEQAIEIYQTVSYVFANGLLGTHMHSKLTLEITHFMIIYDHERFSSVLYKQISLGKSKQLIKVSLTSL